jgi:hypothetical protein
LGDVVELQDASWDYICSKHTASMMLRRLWVFMDLYGYGGWISPFPPVNKQKAPYYGAFLFLSGHITFS